MSNIEKIDKNLAVSENVDVSDLEFFDVREEPFSVYGLYNYKNEPEFKRLPDEVAKSVNEGVAELSYHPAGGRVRFSTTSKSVAIKVSMPHVCRYPGGSLLTGSGLDMYVEEPNLRIYRLAKVFVPPLEMENGYIARFNFPNEQLRYITLHMPSYNPVTSLEVGITKGAHLGEGLKYLGELPIVYYGSSITQGGSASRPGNAYQNIISRRFELDYINLGFSGSGRGEDSIVDYIKSLKMCAFVCDYDHNAPDPEHLRATHLKMYKRIRESHPDIPYIIMSKVDFDYTYGEEGSLYNESIKRREVILDTYRYAKSVGDKNVYFIDGESVFRGNEDISVIDTIHPGDLGMKLMADAVEATLKRAFSQYLISD